MLVFRSSGVIWQFCCSSAKSELPTPDHIQFHDTQVEQLSQDCHRDLRVRYICKQEWALVGFNSKKSYQYWLRRAEGAKAF
ncbi:hypothetical protein [Shewanella surugensis]|uniref:Transposase n=1 Tax=Shewanella surugensis TaxID=212020 RepID=A0ABT0LCA7_9GAMM|nr:hypothetical protein [Shewanella surugensis]MCL1125336.1 hypothetical protein [Shewanella surugensis]